MSSEPALSGKEVVRALKALGFLVDRVEGSHHMMVKPSPANSALRRATRPTHFQAA